MHQRWWCPACFGFLPVLPPQDKAHTESGLAREVQHCVIDMAGSELGDDFLRSEVRHVDVKRDLREGLKCMVQREEFRFAIGSAAPAISLKEGDSEGYEVRTVGRDVVTRAAADPASPAAFDR